MRNRSDLQKTGPELEKPEWNGSRRKNGEKMGTEQDVPFRITAVLRNGNAYFLMTPTVSVRYRASVCNSLVSVRRGSTVVVMCMLVIVAPPIVMGAWSMAFLLGQHVEYYYYK